MQTPLAQPASGVACAERSCCRSHKACGKAFASRSLLRRCRACSRPSRLSAAALIKPRVARLRRRAAHSHLPQANMSHWQAFRERSAICRKQNSLLAAGNSFAKRVAAFAATRVGVACGLGRRRPLPPALSLRCFLRRERQKRRPTAAPANTLQNISRIRARNYARRRRQAQRKCGPALWISFGKLVLLVRKRQPSLLTTSHGSV